MSTEWESQSYCGIIIKCNYQKRVFYLSIPGYVQSALRKFQHSQPTRKENAPHFWERPNYGETQKFSKADDTSRKLTPERILILQKITGTLLFYAKAINLKILVSLGTIAAAQTSGTIEMEKSIHKLIDYFATHPDAILRYKASGMMLRAHSDASYLSELQCRSRSVGFFYMGNATNYLSQPNGVIMVISTIMRNVILLEVEAECGELFYNAKELEALRTTLKEMDIHNGPLILSHTTQQQM